MKKKACLALADGTLFYGKSIGCEGYFVGEVVFNTAMTGYQEIMTDPSYAQQMICFSYPHIGNVGINDEDDESIKIWAGGIIIKELSRKPSNWRSKRDLSDFLHKQNKIGITGIDTRHLIHILREKGSQPGCLIAGDVDPEFALQQARAFSGLQGKNLTQETCTSQPYQWNSVKSNEKSLHVVVMDFGVKQSILQNLADSGCKLTIVPGQTNACDILAMHPDGVFLSNGPGDPSACSEAIDSIKTFLNKNVPIFGICLGHQLLGLASGAQTIKMTVGHHGANHPVINLSSKQVFISSQNHGFAIADDSLPNTIEVTHRSLFDGSIAGIARKDKPAFGFQGHPEASPGPHELLILFQDFVKLMESHYA